MALPALMAPTSALRLSTFLLARTVMIAKATAAMSSIMTRASVLVPRLLQTVLTDWFLNSASSLSVAASRAYNPFISELAAARLASYAAIYCFWVTDRPFACCSCVVREATWD